MKISWSKRAATNSHAEREKVAFPKKFRIFCEDFFHLALRFFYFLEKLELLLPAEISYFLKAEWLAGQNRMRPQNHLEQGLWCFLVFQSASSYGLQTIL